MFIFRKLDLQGKRKNLADCTGKVSKNFIYYNTHTQELCNIDLQKNPRLHQSTHFTHQKSDLRNSRHLVKTKTAPDWVLFSSLGAGKGFEPHDLRVMSPTSYQTALPRDIGIKLWCRRPGSNRHEGLISPDFKSGASAYSATPAFTALIE